MNHLRSNHFCQFLVLSIFFLLLSCSRGESGSPTFVIADKSRYVSDLSIISQAPRSGIDKNHQDVQDLCVSRFTELGFTVERHDYGGGVNVIGTLLGTTLSDEVVIVSAHYDTIVNSNGADDNASGVAAVLESARLLSTTRHERTLAVACWDQEEPAITGSYMYAVKARENNLQIQMAYVYDEIGYTSNKQNSQDFPSGFDILYPLQSLEAHKNQNRANFVLLIFDHQASQFAQTIANSADQVNLMALQLEADLDGRVPVQLRGSDHQSFWDQGYPALEITDSGAYRNPYQHTNMDTINTLDHDFSVKIISAVVASIQTALNP